MSSTEHPRRGIQAGRNPPLHPFQDDDEVYLRIRRQGVSTFPWTPLLLVAGIVTVLILLAAGYIMLRSAKMAAMEAAAAQAQLIMAQKQALQVQRPAEGERLEWEPLHKMPRELEPHERELQK